MVPTRELAVQVRTAIDPLAERRGLRVRAIYGGADIEKQVKDVRQEVQGQAEGIVNRVASIA